MHKTRGVEVAGGGAAPRDADTVVEEPHRQGRAHRVADRADQHCAAILSKEGRNTL